MSKRARNQGRKTLTKNKIVSQVRAKTKLPYRHVYELVTAILYEIQQEALKGNKIVLEGFGKFIPRRYPGRTGPNPANDKITTSLPVQTTRFKPYPAVVKLITEAHKKRVDESDDYP